MTNEELLDALSECFYVDEDGDVSWCGASDKVKYAKNDETQKSLLDFMRGRAMNRIEGTRAEKECYICNYYYGFEPLLAMFTERGRSIKYFCESCLSNMLRCLREKKGA